MASPSLETLAAALDSLAAPDMKPKELLKAVRAAHPGASKKDVVRAAFLSVISNAATDAEKAARLQDFALAERAADDEAPAPAPRPKRRRKSGTPSLI